MESCLGITLTGAVAGRLPTNLEQALETHPDLIRLNAAKYTALSLTRTLEAIDEKSKSLPVKPKIVVDVVDKLRLRIPQGQKVVLRRRDKLTIGLCPHYRGIRFNRPVGGPGAQALLLAPGDELWIADGRVVCTVQETTQRETRVIVRDLQNSSVTIRDRYSCTSPGYFTNGFLLNDWDIEAAAIARRFEVDYLGISFIYAQECVDEALSKLDLGNNKSPAPILKIETESAITSLSKILDQTAKKVKSFGVMIARGDLFNVSRQETLGVYQYEILRKCTERKVPVFVATGLLESMINHPKPTRAEVVDATFACLHGASYLLLTDDMKYLGEAVECLRQIAWQCRKGV